MPVKKELVERRIIVLVYCFRGVYLKSQMEEGLLAKTFSSYSEYKRRTNRQLLLSGSWVRWSLKSG
jgi:hypothetical protein